MTPIKRIEIFMINIAKALKGEEVTKIEPTTRKELFYHNIAKSVKGEEAEVIPKTRDEVFLVDIINAIEGGKGGGSSDVTTALVTIVNNKGTDQSFWGANTLDDGDVHSMEVEMYIEGNETKAFNGALYKGQMWVAYHTGSYSDLTVSGACTKFNYGLVVTGDCTITINE